MEWRGMKKLSPPEWAAVALTCLFLTFFGGWMARGSVSQGWYAVSGQHLELITPSPTPTPSYIPDVLLDINTASAADLAGLPGIGQSKAEAILAYRSVHGPFSSAEELLEVAGIGQSTLERISPYITANVP